MPGNNALPVHPTLDRSLTPREAARIQTFPDTYRFEGDRRRQCIQVGNAVPPRLGQVVARSVAERLLPFRGAAKELDAPVKRSAQTATKQSKRPALNAAYADSNFAFVDLFCGAGGFTLGFARAGLRPLASADLSKFAKATHEANYPEVPFVHSDLGLRETQKAILKIAGAEPFLVAGGPPCQGFSVFGSRRRATKTGVDPRRDPRNRLVFSFIDTVALLRPRWVVMENVPGFVSLDRGSFVDRVRDELTAIGYTNIEWRVIDALDFGVPQRRRRFVLIANRTGHIIPWPKPKFFEAPADWQKPFRTVDEAISDLAEPGSHALFTCHVPMNHKPLQVERYRRIPEGGKLDVAALPPELRVGYRTAEVKNFSHVFKRLHRKKPSITLVPGHNAFPLHPWLDRALTVREAARLQTFPDEIEFKGSREEQCIQVGNAFPPALAELIGNNLIKAERNGWFPGRLPKLALYSLIDVREHQTEFPLTFKEDPQQHGNRRSAA